MKIFISALFVVLVFLLAPTSSAKAEDGIGSLFGTYSDYAAKKHEERKAAKKRHSSALKRRDYSDDVDFEEPDYNNPFDKSEPYFKETKPHKDDRYIKLKRPKNNTPELDTWGRDGGQTTSSEEVLRNMMRPAKK